MLAENKSTKMTRCGCAAFVVLLALAILLLFASGPVFDDALTSSRSDFLSDLYSGSLNDIRYEALQSWNHEDSSVMDAGDVFDSCQENGMQRTAENPVSTFSIDVDTASYGYVRRMLQLSRPNPNSVKTEEMINYFDYDYPLPLQQNTPFLPSVQLSSSCPWAKKSNDCKLLHIGIKGYDHKKKKPRSSNIVLLLDISGSMSGPDRLDLVKQSAELLVEALDPKDRVSIVTYASSTRVVLEPTPVSQRHIIVRALRHLSAGGATAGGAGLQLAYQMARTWFDETGVNRIILATDGDFNVGPTDNLTLTRFIKKQRDSGIYLSVLGFGMGNYHDDRMKALANNGNGVAAYIDTIHEAHKVLVHQASSIVFPIANDVKIQVEFNPKRVANYRLVGYEKRMLAREDFHNDKVDAGDIGSGHTVTAIYEIIEGDNKAMIEPLRYGQEEDGIPSKMNDEVALLKIRYKLPNESESRLITRSITNEDMVDDSSEREKLQSEFEFATSVAYFAQMLQESKYVEEKDGFSKIMDLAESNMGDDKFGYRSEFLDLVRKAESLFEAPLVDLEER